ncbi:hypothetical protein F5984_20050 [Rudanella paleaurantiibacter]|uniref:HTH cro/C1-type domain-containing protein n=1 Tax=Rudanella paleaurantiibacter TaxID=2614655 RepID=A0A7J5TV70_9BACT|nr:helix-turn-helix transcriptional regulator [Rudanella paleaurantiibacter]KAB7728049.1 hypothetical protein F5984_20050 [Rudanella paleaurantiibacter]
MNTSGQRTMLLIESLGLTKNGFAQQIGVSSTVINGIVKDEHKPGPKVLEGIKARYPQVSTDWLLSGTGDMLTKNGDSASFGDQVIERFEVEMKNLREMFTQQLSAKDNQIAGLQRTIDALLTSRERSFHKPATVPAGVPMMSKNLAVSGTA